MLILSQVHVNEAQAPAPIMSRVTTGRADREPVESFIHVFLQQLHGRACGSQRRYVISAKTIEGLTLTKTDTCQCQAAHPLVNILVDMF